MQESYLGVLNGRYRLFVSEEDGTPSSGMLAGVNLGYTLYLISTNPAGRLVVTPQRRNPTQDVTDTVLVDFELEDDPTP